MNKSDRDKAIESARAAILESEAIGTIPTKLVRAMIESEDWSALDLYSPDKVLTAICDKRSR